MTLLFAVKMGSSLSNGYERDTAAAKAGEYKSSFRAFDIFKSIYFGRSWGMRSLHGVHVIMASPGGACIRDVPYTFDPSQHTLWSKFQI